MISAVSFDAIDTLFSAYPDKIGMYQRVLKDKIGLSVTRSEMTEVWNQIVLDTEEEAARSIDNNKLAWDGFNARLLRNLRYQGDDLDNAGKKVLFEVWSNPRNFVLYTDVLPILDVLNIRNVKIICISNETNDLLNFFDHFQIRQYFSDVITSEEAGFEKPNPKIFEFALEKNNLHKNEVIHVGDSIISDYYGAELAGVMPILIDRDGKVRKNIRTVKSLKDITDFME